MIENKLRMVYGIEQRFQPVLVPDLHSNTTNGNKSCKYENSNTKNSKMQTEVCGPLCCSWLGLSSQSGEYDTSFIAENIHLESFL